jgi:putative holliday junction resolvase
MAIAALDLGRRRIGVAVTDAAAIGAHPVGIVERRALKADLEAIAAMLRERRVELIVVGLPLNMDGSEGPAARGARKFAASVAEALGVSVEMFDERLTSFEARERLTDMPVRKGARKTELDALAAVVILEGWMQAHPERIPQR